MRRLLLPAIMCLALLATACRSHQQTVTTAAPHVAPTSRLALESRLNDLTCNQLNWSTMQAGGSIKIGGGKSFSSGMQIRMIRDRAIYISLRPMLGIEVGKIVIANDSVLVVDKYHKRYIHEPISLITNDIPVTVSTMQDIFLGRAFVLGMGTLDSTSQQQAVVVEDNGDFKLVARRQPEAFTYAFGLSSADNHITSLVVTPASATTPPYRATYDDIRGTAAGRIAHNAQINGNVAGSSFALALELKDINWNGDVKIDDSCPGGYKRVDGKHLASLLENK